MGVSRANALSVGGCVGFDFDGDRVCVGGGDAAGGAMGVAAGNEDGPIGVARVRTEQLLTRLVAGLPLLPEECRRVRGYLRALMRDAEMQEQRYWEGAYPQGEKAR